MISLVDALLVGQDAALHIPHLRDQRRRRGHRAEQRKRFIRPVLPVEQQRQQARALLFCGSAKRATCTSPIGGSGRCIRARSVAKAVSASASALAPVSMAWPFAAGSDPLPRGGSIATHAVEHHQRPRLVARSEEAVGKRQPQPVFAGPGSAERPAGQRARPPPCGGT